MEFKKSYKKFFYITLHLSIIFLLLINGCGRRGVNLTSVDNNLIKAQFNEESIVVPDQYIIKRKGNAYLDTPDEFGQKYGLKVLKEIPTIGLELVNIPSESANNVISQLKSNPNIEFIEQNNIRRISIGNKDSSIRNQFNVAGTWNINKGREFISVAMIDTGVDINHPDLKGKLLPGYSVFGDTEMDENGHGTYLSGIIVASNKTMGINGVAPQCKIMPVKVLNKNGVGTDFDIAEGIAWAVDHGAKVICLNAGSNVFGNAISTAIYWAYTKSIPVITGMGNQNASTQWYPSTDKGVISVSSLDISNSRLASFSNVGQWVTLSAPGVGIYSTLPTSPHNYGSQKYGIINSTSTAAAYVAGLAALIKSQYIDISVPQLKDILIKSSDDLGPRGFDPQFGSGRMNIMKALNMKPSLNINLQQSPSNNTYNYNTYNSLSSNNNYTTNYNTKRPSLYY